MSKPDPVTEDLKALIAKHGLGKVAGVADFILAAHLNRSLASIMDTLMVKRLHEEELDAEFKACRGDPTP